MHKYEVIVSNVGTVCLTDDGDDARQRYAEYVELSKSLRGRAGGEDVVLLIGGEINAEFRGSHSLEREDDER